MIIIDYPLIIDYTDPQYKIITSATIELHAGSHANNNCCDLSNGDIVLL